jgi:hypothetical protein
MKFKFVCISFLSFQLITKHDGTEVNVDNLHANDERQMAWRIPTTLVPESSLLGKIIDPLRAIDDDRKIISPAIVTELKG